ncbi:DoxX family protein [Aquabacter spiritensis]|uniref:Putative oxidoreductase n=1 Tax=Aquabacter spiritensis TaxID=933073 RepID=A0A4R3M2T0_9HYPH|nr:DoxX family protein [Aquabacter spiritensis]TCT06529.1 putative oxidoreductase [Aquabacter spiritensis]
MSPHTKSPNMTPTMTPTMPPGPTPADGPAPSTPLARAAAAWRRVTGALDAIPYALLALCARIFPAAVFWQSGATKVEGWRVTEGAVALFQEEYRLPLLDPWLAAHLAAAAEHAFPILLVLGLATRVAAGALLGMIFVIQVFVYPDAWPTHGVWATCLLLLLARGPGALSLDAWIGRGVR